MTDVGNMEPQPDPPSGEAATSERRRRDRRRTRLPAWVYLDVAAPEVFEVLVSDLSPGGAGLISTRPLAAHVALSLKIGLGPLRVPRPARVAHSRRRSDGRFHIGVRFT